MASLQEHLDETRAAQERVDKHLTKRSATESSILKEVLTLVTLYGKLGEAVEGVQAAIRAVGRADERYAVGLHNRLDELEENTLYGKLGESIERIESKLDRLMETQERGEHQRAGTAYKVLEIKNQVKRLPILEDKLGQILAEVSQEEEPKEPGLFDKTVNLKASLPGAYVTTSWPEDSVDKRFASYKPYGPPPGFPDEDQSYGEYDDAS